MVSTRVVEPPSAARRVETSPGSTTDLWTSKQRAAVRILLATQAFHHVGGTETHVLTVAERPRRLGHEVRIYAQQLGDMTMLARDRAVDVVGDLDEVGTPGDVFPTQDSGMAYELADRYPGVPQVFVSHSARGVVGAGAVVVRDVPARRRRDGRGSTRSRPVTLGPWTCP